MNNYSKDFLIVLKEDKKVKATKIIELYSWLFCDYDVKSMKYKETDTFTIGEQYDEYCFDGQEFRICSNFYSKLKYAAAGLYDDEKLLMAIKQILPNIKKLKIPSIRYTTNYYLPYWLEKYHIELVDFLTNNKYVVISDLPYNANIFDQLNNLGLINWEDFEYFCEGLGDDEYEAED